MVSILFLAALAPAATSAAVFPPEYAHWALALDELFEQLDVFSSAQYAHAAWKRAFGSEPWTEVVCPDGLRLEPVLQTDCPRLSATVGNCSSALEGELCLDGGPCGWEGKVGNCPLLPSGRQTVLMKVARACRGRGSGHCKVVARALSTVSIVTFIVSCLFRLVVSVTAKFEADDYPVWGCLPCWCVALLAVAALIPIAWLTPAPWPAVLGVLVPIASLLCTCVTSVDSPSANEIPWNGYAVTCLPIIGVYAAWRMGPERAAENEEVWRVSKFFHRVLEDIPEAVCAAVDLYYFGASWPAACDLGVTILMIIYHVLVFLFPYMAAFACCLVGCLVRCFAEIVRCFAESPKVIDAVIAEKVGADH